jgi:hypothetical protein
MRLCHDENQKHTIAHEEHQNRKGTAEPQMNTDGHRSEGVAKKTVVSQQVKDFFHKNLCLSVCICGINSFCQPNRGKNLKMPKKPKSVQFRPEPMYQSRLSRLTLPPGFRKLAL